MRHAARKFGNRVVNFVIAIVNSLTGTEYDYVTVGNATAPEQTEVIAAEWLSKFVPPPEIPEPPPPPPPEARVVFMQAAIAHIHEFYTPEFGKHIYQAACDIGYVRNPGYNGEHIGHLELDNGLSEAGEWYTFRDMESPLVTVELIMFVDPEDWEIVVIDAYHEWSRYRPEGRLEACGVEFANYLVRKRNRQL